MYVAVCEILCNLLASCRNRVDKFCTLLSYFQRLQVRVETLMAESSRREKLPMLTHYYNLYCKPIIRKK